ncbi:DUF3806 domain-containing protein [Pseudomaricurvus alkylphenolicus]|jgi:hypothetical protein|uniref:DUF3806 domain-containing protein n=1 Tax=Pseudomaricurvus alkylphenolicus TaxID=1306991 RepID=UPI00141F3DDE|nr:DUF3806 domain-containing protein [Pseudomaricurvus alkylphenolicus]NIB43733.1 DUF3806 domain-containing protein [Pseudomaricurvus alkylphenolicus]
MKRFLSLCLLLSLFNASFAQDVLDTDKKAVSIEELSWMDRRHLERQVEKIDEMARIKLGMQVTGTTQDLRLLQRVIHRGLIQKDERLSLQALGAVLGNVMVAEWGLQWVVYEDKVGRSRAICVADTEYCLFPITMLSRRMEVGLLPNVQKVYDNSHEMILPYLPKSPFDTES